MKTIHSLTLTLAAAFALVIPVRAQTVSPVPAPTIITRAPYTITAPGYYQLGADLTVSSTTGNIITIAASNVTLDFAGHYISGPSSASAVQSGTLNGVYASEQGNLNIRNGTVAFCFYGIFLAGNNQSGSLNINQRIDNMLVSYCSYDAILDEYANNSSVTNCRVSFTGGNTAQTYTLGISFVGGTGNTVAGCTVTNTTGSSSAHNIYGIYNTGTLSAQNNAVTNTTAGMGDIAAGIYNENDGTLTAQNNAVSGVSSGAEGSAIGIYEATFAVGNTVSNATFAFYSCIKYANNLTNGCTYAFEGGTGVGYNN